MDPVGVRRAAPPVPSDGPGLAWGGLAGPVAAWEVVGLLLLVISEAAAASLSDGVALEAAGLTAAVSLALLLGFGALGAIRADPLALWTPLVPFRLVTALYFGLGQTVPALAGVDVREAMDRFYPVSAADLMKVDLVVAAGVLAVLGSAAATTALLPERRRPPPFTPARRDRRPHIGLLFLIAGGLARYGLELPVELGTSASRLSGVGGALSNLLPVGLLILADWGMEERRPATLALVLALAAADAAVGVLTFSKAAVLLPVVVVALAWVHRRPTGMRFAAIGLLVALLYAVVSPIVSDGREQLLDRYGEISGAPVAERLSIVEHYVAAPGEGASGWARLSYANAAAFAIGEHDAGAGGDTLENAAAVFVPRLLWPDKPVITDLGPRFNALATGSDSSSSSPGLFAEAYWDYGWAGLALLIAPLGVLFALWSAYSRDVVQRGRWLFLPVVLVGMRMGARVDGLYVADVLGPFAIAVSLQLLLSMADRLFRDSPRQ